MKTQLFRLLAVAFIALPGATLFAQLHDDYYETTPQTAAGDAAQISFAESALIDLDSPPDFGDPADSSGAAPASAAGAGDAASSSSSAALIGAEIGGGGFEANGVKGDLYTVRIPYSRKMSERSTLQLTIPLSITNYDDTLPVGAALKDAQAYGAGVTAGWAWQKFLKSDNVPYRWKITPSAGVFYRDSSDLRVGALVFNFGLSSSFAYQFKPGWVINLGNSVSTAWNNGIRDYPDPVRDDQQSMANGLQLIRMQGRWSWHAYIAHTQMFNENTLVDNFHTLGAGAAFKLTRTRSLRATVITEEGNGGYKSTRATLGTTWNF